MNKSLRRVLQAYRFRRRRAERLKSVPLDRLLCGGEHGVSAALYASYTGDLLRPSTPIKHSPHVRFLEQYLHIGDEIFRPPSFRQTAYFANAVECMNVFGEYFTCTREEQIEQIARRFVSKFRDEPMSANAPGDPYHFSADDSEIVVCPIRYSDCYEVVDGNHRLAIAYVRGQRAINVQVASPPVLTPLQSLLLDVASCGGRRELLQPVNSPELNEEWTLLRRCSDRFELMKQFLEEHDLLPSSGCRTYLDIGCGYGWFVQAFGHLGFDAFGAERDWAATEVGRLAYGLKTGQVTRTEMVEFLQSDRGVFDVVSCLGIPQELVRVRDSISAEELLRLLDDATARVLFFEMGQNHAEWDVSHIEQWLRSNSSFKKIYQLGAERQGTLTMFACLR